MYRAAVAAVGPFDVRLGVGTRFPGGDDNDFGLRLLEHGFRIAYVPEAVITHRAWRGAAEFVPLGWAYGRGQGALYAKYASLRDQYMLRRGLRDFRRAFRKAIWRMQRREVTLGRADMAYALGLVSGAAEWLWTGRKAT
jgi:GT2 family glycosyltransferase